MSVRDALIKYNARIERDDDVLVAEITDPKMKFPFYVIVEGEEIRHELPPYLRSTPYWRVYDEEARKTVEEIKEDAKKSEANEVDVDVSPDLLLKAGYRSVGGGVYQRPVGEKHSGFYRVVIGKRGCTLSLTPGSYENPKELVERERERLMKLRTSS